MKVFTTHFLVVASFFFIFTSGTPLAGGRDEENDETRNGGVLSDDENLGTLKENEEGPECTDMRLCMHNCPLGHALDDDGCEICEECKKSGVFEEDILVDEGDTYDNLVRTYGGSTCPQKVARGASSDKSLEWPKKGDFVIIGYEFHENINNYTRLRIQAAFRKYHQNTCIRFRPRRGQRDYIRLRDDLPGCSSFVGRTGVRQDVRIGKGCAVKLGTIIHELMHVLGFWHEQSRGDRNQFVRVNLENVRETSTLNFQKRSRQSNWNPYGSPYDVGSVMHYDGYAFTKNGKPSIIDLKTGKAVISQRNGFSEEDVIQINRKYGCTGPPTENVTRRKEERVGKEGAVLIEVISDYENSVEEETLSVSRDTAQSSKALYEVELKIPSVSEEVGVNPTTTRASTTQRPSTTRRTTTRRTTTRATTRRTTTKRTTTESTTVPPAQCFNIEGELECNYWESIGHCGQNGYVNRNCRKACTKCTGLSTTQSTTTTTTTTTRPRTTTKAATEQPISSGDCEDKLPLRSCTVWKDRGYCTELYTEYMKLNCRETCEHCSKGQGTSKPPTTCKNNLKSCERWAENDFCTEGEYIEVLRTHCKLSCTEKGVAGLC